jgi:hypothetical protein
VRRREQRVVVRVGRGAVDQLGGGGGVQRLAAGVANPIGCEVEAGQRRVGGEGGGDYGGGRVGWAPLPPVAVATVNVGIGRWADTRWGIGPSHYNFVGVRDFGARSLVNVIIPRQQNVNIVQNTNNITTNLNTTDQRKLLSMPNIILERM